jgi:DNA-3-methyladenine glycosylase II
MTPNLQVRPDYWDTATRMLSAADPVISAQIVRLQALEFATRGDPFSTLARSIVGQQISNPAAATVWQRLQDVVAVVPEAILAAEDAHLASCGLSGRKVAYLKNLAEHFAHGALRDYDWQAANDEEIIQQLTQVKGIGRWTVEMFLIFHLVRPDVLPVDDYGLRRAIGLHYFKGQMPNIRQVREVAEAWRPYRSVATWYLWRSLEPNPIVY